MGGGAGLAEGVPKVNGVVVFSAATGVLGAPKVKGAGLAGLVSFSGAPNVKGAGLAGFVSLLSAAPKLKGAGLTDLALSDGAPKENKLLDATGFGASIRGAGADG